MKRFLAIILAFNIGLVSCKKFGDTNLSPIALTSPTTRALLTNSLQSLPRLMFPGIIVNTNAANINASFYVQYLSEAYPGQSLYSDKNLSFSNWYTGPLYNLSKIIEYNATNSPYADPAINGSVNNQTAVARMLRAFYFLQITDRWGDVPYSKALQGEAAFAPVYDKQQDIYTALFKELKAANDQVNTSEKGVVGDILLDGDMLAWKRFANTTRMIMALRLSRVDGAKGKTEYDAALADGVIISNTQNVNYKFISSDPNNYNPWYQNYTVDNRNDYAISNTVTDYMSPKNDARLKVYGESLSGGVIKGLPYGRMTPVNIPGAYSRIGDAFRGAGSKLNIYSYAQVLFMQAEAAKIGYSTGGDAAAETKYRSAIESSWREFNVYDATAFSNYMALPEISYNSVNGYKQIITEKWVAGYLKGWEAWNDWRRTDFPTLTPAVDAVDTRGIPTRQGYPTNEASLNTVNYNAAVAAMGGSDNNYVKVWWDK